MGEAALALAVRAECESRSLLGMTNERGKGKSSSSKGNADPYGMTNKGTSKRNGESNEARATGKNGQHQSSNRCNGDDNILGLRRGEMIEGLRFLWNATRGERLRPWRSPYLRWRLETYTGQRADTIQASDFWRLFWSEKRQLFRFLRWTGEIKGYTNTTKER
jgi:hypothetical protein